ncbi:MAG: PIG-L deacetylase family protein [Candidatus Dormibacterales bacterium]
MAEAGENGERPAGEGGVLDAKGKAFERVLVVSAHPDDPEFGFGATVARLSAEGAEVTYVICTDGSQGGEDPSVPDEELIAIRQREQHEAARLLGVQDVVFLGHRDGSLSPDLGLRRDIVKEIRRHRPDLVLTHSPLRSLAAGIGASHPDHVAVGEATLAACYPDSRNPRAFRDLLAEGLEPHRVREVWLPGYDGADHFVDVSTTLDKKIAAIRAHESQVSKPGQEPSEFERWVRDRARQFGEKGGFEYAEAFRRLEIG